MTITLDKHADNAKIQADTKMNVAHYLFLLFWLLKPIYSRESGTLQIADLVFVMSFVSWIFINRANLVLSSTNGWFACFVSGVFIVNSIYAALYHNINFMLQTSYYMFNLLIVLEFSDMASNNRFLKALMKVTVFNLLLQLIVLFLRTGRYYDSVRYMGTFNDPNQFSFFVLASFLLIYILLRYFAGTNGRGVMLKSLSLFTIAFFLISQGTSTGALLGIAAFIFMLIIAFVSSKKSPGFMFLKIVIYFFFGAFVVYTVLTGLTSDFVKSGRYSDNFFIMRLAEKFGKITSGGIRAIMEERGISNVLENPLYLFFGAGEGGNARFAFSGEVHSTLIGIAFYYGILPFMLLLKWIRENTRNVQGMLLPVFFALLVESLILANQRQPILWMIIVLGNLEFRVKPLKRIVTIKVRI